MCFYFHKTLREGERQVSDFTFILALTILPCLFTYLSSLGSQRFCQFLCLQEVSYILSSVVRDHCIRTDSDYTSWQFHFVHCAFIQGEMLAVVIRHFSQTEPWGDERSRKPSFFGEFLLQTFSSIHQQPSSFYFLNIFQIYPFLSISTPFHIQPSCYHLSFSLTDLSKSILTSLLHKTFWGHPYTLRIKTIPIKDWITRLQTDSLASYGSLSLLHSSKSQDFS